MLLFSDKNELKRRIKELEESLSEANLLKKRYKERVEELNKHVTSMDYHYEAEEKRWAEKLESYEESLKRRDLTISAMELLHKQLEEQIESLEEELEKASEGSVAMLNDLRLVESAYNDLDELLQKTNKSLEACGERLWELDEENSHLREELHDAMMEIERLKEQSKSPYPTVTVNVDVRDTLAKQLAKSLKQANEAFEKRSKEKRFSFFYEGIDYSSDSRAKLSEQFDNMFKLSLHEYASLLRLLDSLEKELEHKDFANGARSLYSKKLQERVFITFKATKEEIQMEYLTKGQVIALTVGIGVFFGAILACCFGFFVLLFGATTVFQFLGMVWLLVAVKHYVDALFKLYDKAKEELM